MTIVRKSRLGCFGVLAGCGFALSAGAAIDAGVPVVIVMNERVFAGGSGFGFIGGIIGSSANKVAGAQVSEFSKRTAGIDWKRLASEEFACFAITDPQTGQCRKVFVLDGQKDIDELLADQGAQRVIVIELAQMFRTSIRYRARAVVHDTSRGKKGYHDDRVFTALYETILPVPHWNASVPEADSWWAEGSPSRLEADARRSLRELREMAEYVELLTRDKWSVPKDWKRLPKVATLMKDGRARCDGLPCGNVRVLEERNGRTWLVNDRPLLPSYGPAIASLDGQALLNQTNLFVLVSVPY